ncbi:putative J domain-containing protein [Seiridium cardinale]
MRFSALSVGLLALLTPLVAAWSKEDHEIFRIRDELMAHEGANVTFYDFVGVTASASQEEIKRAYRKRSKTLHPDKVKSQLTAKAAQAKKDKSKKPGVTVSKPPTQSEIKAAVKDASERQTRLGVVANILTGPERARYDHFMANGFPTWKGTGYYYSRYRPGLGTVLIGVFLAGGGAFHYVALYMGWKRQREFIERYIKFARHAAWGENLGIAGVEAGATAPAPPPPAAEDEQGPLMPTNRKQRREQERLAKKENAKEGKRTGRSRAVKNASGSATPVPQTQPSSGSGPTGAKKRVVAENGKVLVVDSLGDVYLEQEDEDGNVQEFLLDPNEMPMPTIRDTALFRLPIWVFRRITGKKDVQDQFDEEDEVSEEIVDDDSDIPQRTPSSTDSNDDFELLDATQSVQDLAKATGSKSQGSGKAKKRSKKR